MKKHFEKILAETLAKHIILGAIFVILMSKCEFKIIDFFFNLHLCDLGEVIPGQVHESSNWQPEFTLGFALVDLV